MMNRILLFIAVAFFMMSPDTNGQIINNSIFPEVGDTLRTVRDNFFTEFDTEMTGTDLEWDLRALSGTVLIESTYEAPSEGNSAATFPNADLLDRSNGQEIYYEVFGNKIVELGRSGLDPVLNALDLTYTNEGEAVLRRANFGITDNYDSNSSFSIKSSTEIIPDSIIPGLSAIVDSLRLTVSTGNDDDIDASGIMMLPNGDYEVVRQKRTTTTNAELEIFTALFGWQPVDPSNPLFSGLGDALDLLGETVTVSYQFFANDNKEIIADIATDMDGNPLGVTYKGDISTTTKVVSVTDKNILTYPNPTYGNVTFELLNLPKDNYTIEIYNIIGKKLKSEEVPFLTNRLNTNVGDLRKGTYLYSVIDGNGNKITTRRLVIITP